MRVIHFALVALMLGCGTPSAAPDATHSDQWVADSVPPHVRVVASSTQKICQLVGDRDRELDQATLNLTLTRYGIYGSDLGIAAEHKGRLYLLFGDTVSPTGPKDGDAFAFTEDTDPSDCVSLTFPDNAGVYTPLLIPGISQGAFEVPSGAVSVDGRLLVYFTTDHSETNTMGRSVVAVSDEQVQSFQLRYTLSTQHFINVAPVKSRAQLVGVPASVTSGEILLLFGSGDYRKSAVRLAIHPTSSAATNVDALRYFSGLDRNGAPTFSSDESSAVPLFDSSCVGELSAAYLADLQRWILLYNCNSNASEGHGIFLRSAPAPWGPWSQAEKVFDVATDKGYCHFIHKSWLSENCDNVHDPGRENEGGGAYGPYIISRYTTAIGAETQLYFTLSTWNPYTVMLMRTRLSLQ